jgi:hypothetical protein
MRIWVAVGSVLAAAGLSLIPISSALAAPAHAKSGPSITHFDATPKVFGPRGGVLHYSAHLADTRTYTLSATPAIAGLPRTLKAHRRVAGVIHIPANRSARTRTYFLTFGTWNGIHKSVTLIVRSQPVKPPRPLAPTTTTSVPVPPPTSHPTTSPPPTSPPVTPPPTSSPPTTTTLLSWSIGAVNANNPLYNGQPGDNGQVDCYLYKFYEAVCGSMTISFQTSAYQGEPPDVNWLVSADASRTFGCYLKSTGEFEPVTTVTGTYIFDQYDNGGGNAAGITGDSYFFGNSDIPSYSCPAAADQVAYGVHVSDVVATLVDGSFDDPASPVFAKLDIPGDFNTPPFADPYIGDDG